tara:strand:+ start:188 stop:904 length:717 start_codon:yes stop_codon:yes gene_type:complete
MKLDVDTKERMKVLFIFLLQSYKVAMGSMLTLFVPQLCGDQVCGLTDNLVKEGDLHRVSLSINFISLVSFLACYYIELQRENWCIKYLDLSDDFGDNNLQLVLKKRPELELRLHNINDKYYYSSQITAVIYVVNLILSTVSVYMNSAGSSTITAYMSFVILILMKLNNSIQISKASKHNNLALSAYMTELQSFNVVDKDYENHFEVIEIVETGDIELEEVKSVSEIKDSVLVADLNTI